MVMLLGEVITRYTADVSGYSKGMATMESETVATGAKMGAGMAIAGIAIAATAIAVGAVTVKMASDFRTGITTLETGAGEANKNLGMVGEGIKKVAVDTGTMTGPLIAGMFMIESAGFRGAAGINVLDVAARGAKVGGAELGVTADAVTTILKDFGMGSDKAATAMNFLTGIVQNGKTHLQDLAASMSTVLPTAAAMGVHLIDVGAAMATMTGQGINADKAATFLRQTIISLSAELPKGAASLRDIGLSAQQVSDGMKKSLPDTLQLIMTHLAETYKVGSPQYVDALRNIAGGSKQMQGILALTGVHLKDFGQNMKNVAGVMNEGKNSVVGWTAVQGDLAVQVDRGKAALQVLGITVGQELLPVLTKIVAAVVPIIANMTSWLVANHAIMPILIALAVVIGVVVVGALASMAVAVIAATWPFILAAAAIAAAIAIIVVVIMHWGAIVTWLKNVWATISGFFVGLWNGIKATFTNATSAIGAFVGNVFSQIGTQLRAIWTGIATFFTGIWNAIKAFATAAFIAIVAAILGPFLPLIVWIVTNWTSILNFLRGIWVLIQAGAQFIWSAITAFISAQVTAVSNFIRPIWSAISSFLTGVWNAIKGVATAVWNAITFVIQADLYVARAIISTVWGAISSFLSGVWNAIRSAASAVWNAITSVIGSATNTVSGNTRSVWGAISGFIMGLWNAIRSAAASIWAAITGVISNAWNMILGIIRSVGGAIQNALISPFQAALGAITGIVGGIVGAVQGALSWIANLGAASNNVHVPAHAGGTSFFAGGLTWVGEAGRELVWLPTGTGITPHGQSEQIAAGYTPTGASRSTYTPSGGPGGRATYILQVDGRELASALGGHLASEIRLQLGLR